MTKSQNKQSSGLLAQAFGVAKKLSLELQKRQVAPTTSANESAHSSNVIEGSARFKTPFDVEKYETPQQMLRQQLAYQREQQAQMELGQAMQSGDRLDRKSEVIAARTGAKLQRDEALIQQKEFEDKVDYSTITLTLYQLSKIRQTEMVDAEAVFQKHSPGFFTRLFDALRVGWYGVLDLFIGLMNVWPLWLVMGLGLYGLRRWAVSRRKPRAVPPPPPAME